MKNEVLIYLHLDMLGNEICTKFMSVNQELRIEAFHLCWVKTGVSQADFFDKVWQTVKLPSFNVYSKTVQRCSPLQTSQ